MTDQHTKHLQFALQAISDMMLNSNITPDNALDYIYRIEELCTVARSNYAMSKSNARQAEIEQLRAEVERMKIGKSIL